ncbi:MAG: glycoside hydrolase family 2 TIM barrel-domain containing protein [Chloroflexota bacterium]
MKAFDLSGQWYYTTKDDPQFSAADVDHSDWPSMHIPQNWFLGGLDHHGVAWFRYEFTYKPTNKPLTSLFFNGVDYFADVYLNGQFMGHHEGYFEPFSFDVTRTLKKGINLLAVRVESPYEPVGSEGWHIRKKLIKGVLNHHDCRPGGGWGPQGQSYNTGGIWNRVYLQDHGAIIMENILLRAELESSPPVLVANARGKNYARERQTKLKIRCEPHNFQGGEYARELFLDIPSGESSHQFSLPVPDVQLWQPWDRGYPHIYQVTLSLNGYESTTLFGFRSVRVDKGYNWHINGERYFLRGSNYIASQWLSETLFTDVAYAAEHPFGGHGLTEGQTSVIQAGHWPEVSDNWFERDVTLAKQANLNILRVHAHVLPPEFHEACDKSGIMVWQDFPLQWGYTDEPRFHKEAERQAKAMVELLYNHPSIVAWCCHNESPWDAPWMASEVGERFDRDHNRTLDERLERAIRSIDSTRYVHRNSGTGDGHTYPGWYFGKWQDYLNLPAAPFPTEYGAQGLPVKESVLRMFARLGPDAGHNQLVRLKTWLAEHNPVSPATQALARWGTLFWNLTERLPFRKQLQNWISGWGINVERSPYQNLPPIEEIPEDLRLAYQTWESWRFHNFQPPETFQDERVSMGASLDDFITSSQVYQSKIIQFATETYRRHKFKPINGLIHFMFTDPWPAITWSVLDYWRLPKSAYEVLGRVMQPILPMFELPLIIHADRRFTAQLQVVNDRLDSHEDVQYEWRLVNEHDKPTLSGNRRMNIPANSASLPVSVQFPPLSAGRYRLEVTLNGAQGNILGENSYEFDVE